METIPIPTPPIIRKTTSWKKLLHKAHPAADMQNRTAAASIVLFLPALSDMMPATDTPAIEPIRAHPTYHPCSSVSSPNRVVTLDIVPEMTAVSYPKRIPPMAATIERNIS